MAFSSSRYIESKAHLRRLGDERELALRESAARLASGEMNQEAWMRAAKEDFPRIVTYLNTSCGIDFRGRVLEIGAGGAWLSAELSKLPKVVEITAIDIWPKALKDWAPKVFEMLQAHTSKITRTPGDAQKLVFPDDHFDFVVCSSVLHYSENIVQVLREAKRVLKPGGQFVAVREPIWPLVNMKSRSRLMARLIATGYNDRFYTLSDYRELFKQAGLKLETRQVNISTGFRYYVDSVVNGITHARYAFIATKKRQANPAAAKARQR